MTFSPVNRTRLCGPQRSSTFLAPGTDFLEDRFSTEWEGGWLRNDSSAFYLLYFYYYYISSTSDQQALDLGGWGPLAKIPVLNLCAVFLFHTYVLLIKLFPRVVWSCPASPSGSCKNSYVISWNAGEGQDEGFWVKQNPRHMPLYVCVCRGDCAALSEWRSMPHQSWLMNYSWSL